MNMKPGELQLPFRVMLVGDKFGPSVFEISEILGREETIIRIQDGLKVLSPTVNFLKLQDHLKIVNINAHKIISLYNKQDVSQLKYFLLGFSQRLFYATSSLLELLKVYATNEIHEYAIGITIRSLLLDHLIILSVYKKIDESELDDLEAIEKKLSSIAMDYLADGLSQTFDYLNKLKKHNIREENEVKKAKDNFIRKYKAFFVGENGNYKLKKRNEIKKASELFEENYSQEI